MTNNISIAIAGSTSRTTSVAQVLLDNPSFEILYVLTPAPKKIGRKQILTHNPVDGFSLENNIDKILIEENINKSIQKEIFEQKKPDILLVVDFGYFVPQWLLDWPIIAPINIHPSELPRWRGSSPGQFSLLFGDAKSAVSVIIMNDKLDQGPIIHQEFFDMGENWTQSEYYSHSFDLISPKLPQILLDFTQKKLTPNPQSPTTPTPIARQLKKQDSFVNWTTLQDILKTNNKKPSSFSQEILEIISREIKTKPVLETILKNTPLENQPSITCSASRAFFPWPGLWTIIPTQKGEKRMKILSCTLKNNKLELTQVQIEGKNATKWSEIKNSLS